MGDMVHGRYDSNEIWYIKDMVHPRYGTRVISYMADMVHGRCGPCRYGT